MRKQILAMSVMAVMFLAACGNNDSKDVAPSPEVNIDATNTQAPTGVPKDSNTTINAPENANGNQGNVTENPNGNQEQATENADDNQEHVTEDVRIQTADEALTRLKEGNRRFLSDESEMINVSGERRQQLEDGQEPYVVVVSCSDSRVTPTAVFNVGLGEIFDVRIAGNVVDKDALGSIEYGVEHLHAPLIVVMGHEKCGAVTAAYDKLKKGTEVDGNIKSIVDKITPSIKDSDDLDEAIHDNIDKVADTIENDKIVKHLMDQGKVRLVKAYYALDGTVTFDE